MEKLSKELQDLVQERKLYVEDELLQKSNEKDEYKCFLQKIAVEFVESVPILPLTTSNDSLGKCPPFTGVYLIYYVGETSLYGGLVSSSCKRPIFVGRSQRNILKRLKDHHNKVANAKDLEVKDFAVRYMIVDIGSYVHSLEGMLKDYYTPLWNDPILQFSFGNANDNNNNWFRYHVISDEDTRREMIKRVRKYIQDRKTSAQSDHHTSVNPP